MKKKSELTGLTDSSPSLQKALAHIKGLLNKLQQGERIPPIRVLISHAGVSPRYMCRAVALMAGENKLTIIKGKGVFAGTVTTPAVTISRLKWERTTERLTRDILDNTFNAEMLPSLSRLRKLYGVSNEVIKKAIVSLLNQRLLVDDRHGYRIRLPGHTRSFSSVLFITPGVAPSGRAVIFDERLRQAHIQLETICNSQALHFAQRSFSPDENWVPGCLGDPQSHIGYIVWSNGINVQLLRSLLHDLSRHKRPIAIIDEIGDWKPPTGLPPHARLHIFAIAGFLAGTTAARFLLSLGHRGIAYFSVFENQFWSRERHRGLRSEFGRAGIQDGVMAETLDRMPDYDRKKQYPFGPMALASSRAIGRLPEAYHRHFGSQFWNIASHLNLMRDIDHFSTALEAVFRRMLDTKGITALVAANTMLAISALIFLERHAVSVPQQVSLLCFDNTPEAYQNNLSCYEFNFAGMARAAFSFIVHPSNRLFSKKHSRTEYEGIFINRGSTARAAISQRN
jgi:DNA-binding FadR family transcriptional regulator